MRRLTPISTRTYTHCPYPSLFRSRADREFGIESIRHHHITPDEAAEGVAVTAAVREFLHWLEGRTLLGYHLAFDLAMLSPHVRGLAGFGLPNPRVDLADAFAARARRAQPNAPPNLDFQHIARSEEHTSELQS